MQNAPLEQLGFFNTTRERGERLKSSQKKANRQEVLIMGFFRDHPTQACSPDYVYKSVFDENTPLTSIRRAMTSLTKQELLRKTDLQVPGPYGKLTYTWTLASE